SQTDQSTGGNLEIHAHTAGAMIVHLQHFAAPAAQRFQDYSDEVFRNVYDQSLDRFELFAAFVANNNFRFAYHQLEALAAHRFDQNGELQFTAAQHAERFRRIRIFHADGNVCEQLALKAVAQVA